MSHKPVPFAEVLAHELRVVRKRRAGLWAVNRAAPGAPPPGAPDPEPTDAERQLPNPDDGLERLRKAALDEGLAGLALSGGGIRSGTFALGFLQGLARLRLLRAFDYVSTVSGGGYTGAWLAAWVYREGLGAAERQADPRRALANVETQLNPDRVRQADATRAVVVGAGTTAERPHQLLRDPAGAAPAVRPVVLDDEPEPVYHLRAYSNYLTPRPGLFSADTWTLFAIYARNTLVNLLILVPAVFVVVLAAQLAVWGCARGGAGVGQWAVAGAFLAAALLGLVTIGRDQLALQQARQAPAAARAAGRGAETSVGRFVWLIVVPCVVTAALGAWLLTVDPDDPTGGRLRHPAFDLVNGGAGAEAVPVWVKYVVGFAALGAVAGLAGAAVRWLTGRGRVWVAFASPVVLGVGVGALSYPALRYALWELTGCPAALTAVGPPLFLLAFAVAGFLESALLSRALSEYEREWRSRLAGNLVIAAGAWLVFFGTIFFLPPAVVWLAGQTRLGEAGTWVAVGGWVATTLAGLLAAKSPRTGGDAGRAASPVLEVVAGVGPIVFLVGLLGVLGALSTLLVGGHTDGTRLYVPGEPPAGLAALLWIVGGAAGCAVVSVGLSAATDANVFSLHALYANRLVRCYLGASRRKAQASDEREYGRLRPPAGPTGPGAQVWEWGPGTGGAPTGAGQGVRRENPVTGFDPFDDVSLGALRAEGADGRVTALRYQGPYPLFNAALNLVAGDELAVQDRRAASFVLSPGYCGSEETGFAATPTADGNRANLTLGRAMTISGAAVDPNMSFHHSPPVTALLTVFNARLGWWLQNPRVPDAAPWAAAPPRGGVLQQLGREFFGLTDEKGSYVHLSDGGHFDNSGVYELIRRRCRFVVAVDAAQDRDDASENLAALVRLVRADFGIRIEIDTTPLRKGPDGLSRWHVAVGLIRYDDVDDHALAGTLVFVRSSLTGDEPSDVRQYAATHPEYPHTSTADQFFDDAQFESYRMLGEHAAVSVFEEAVVAGRTRFDVAELKDDTGHRTAVRELFAAVRNRWFPPPPAFDQNYADAGHECARLMSQIRTDPNLDGFAHALYPELPPEAGGAPGADAAPADALGRPHELLAVNQMLDVMERAWLGIQLGTYHAHPMHRGWMNAFRRWTSSATFRRVWPVVRGEFSKDFVRFCERALNLPPVRAVPRPVASDAELERVRQLDAEFLREWGQQFGRVREQEAGRSTAAHPLLEQLAAAPEQDGYLTAAVRATRGEWPGEPLAWLLYLSELRPDGTDAVIDRLQDFPVGLLAVTPRPGPGPGYEIVFWVRPAYRSLNLGRSAIEYPEGGTPGGEKLYLKIRRLLRERYPEKDIILRAHYPTSAAVGGDRLQRALWINFFHDYDFRRVREPADGPFITVEYTVRPAG